MRSVYTAIWLTSYLLLNGCAQKQLSEINLLPSLMEQRNYIVIQVAANFDPTIKRDHPYFVLCQASDCSGITPKTPIRTQPLVVTKSVPTDQSITSQTSVQPSVDGDLVLNETDNDKPFNATELLAQYRVHFDYASSTLSPDQVITLNRFIREYPHENRRIRITGFTDSVSIPDGKIANEWLALDRAVNTKNKLISLGYPESQILLEAKFLCCYLDSNESPAGRYRNRRAEITVIKKP